MTTIYLIALALTAGCTGAGVVWLYLRSDLDQYRALVRDMSADLTFCTCHDTRSPARIDRDRTDYEADRQYDADEESR